MDTLTKYIGIFSTLVIYHGILYSMVFYYFFNISIISYIDFTEGVFFGFYVIPFLFFSFIGYTIGAIIFIYIIKSTTSILYFKDYLKDLFSKRFINRFISIVGILSVIIVIYIYNGLLDSILHTPKKWNYLLFHTVFSLGFIFIFFIINEFFFQLKILYINKLTYLLPVIVCLSTLMTTFQAFLDFQKSKDNLEGKNYNIQTNSEELTSTRSKKLIGETKSHIFLYDYSSKNTTVIPRSQIQKITFTKR